MRLVVSNLPSGTTEAEVRQIFGPYGTVTSVDFFPLNQTFAAVVFSSQAEAAAAWQGVHRSTYQGNLLQVVIGSRTGGPLP